MKQRSFMHRCSFHRFNFAMLGAALVMGICTSTSLGTNYYVSPNGSNGNNGTSSNSPWQTLNYSVSHSGFSLAPGDTLYVMPGTYQEGLLSNIPSGTSWSSPVTLKAYDFNNKPVMLPPTNTRRVIDFTGAGSKYIVVDGLVLDATNVTYDAVKITTDANHIRIQNSTIKNSPNQGVLITSEGSNYNELIGNYFVNNGVTDLDHHAYISTDFNLIDHNEFAGPWGGFAIHRYGGGDYNVISNNKIHDNMPVEGMIIAGGVGDIIYNNVIWNVGGGIRVDYSGNGAQIYNNTVFNSDIPIRVTTDNNVVKNNIASRSATTGQPDIGITNTSHNNTVMYNLTGKVAVSNAGSGNSVSNNIVDDPDFVNSLLADFHLLSGSPALDAGTLIALFTKDLDGVLRPQGAAWDIGAYEFVVPEPTCLTPLILGGLLTVRRGWRVSQRTRNTRRETES